MICNQWLLAMDDYEFFHHPEGFLEINDWIQLTELLYDIVTEQYKCKYKQDNLSNYDPSFSLIESKLLQQLYERE